MIKSTRNMVKYGQIGSYLVESEVHSGSNRVILGSVYRYRARELPGRPYLLLYTPPLPVPPLGTPSLSPSSLPYWVSALHLPWLGLRAIGLYWRPGRCLRVHIQGPEYYLEASYGWPSWPGPGGTLVVPGGTWHREVPGSTWRYLAPGGT